MRCDAKVETAARRGLLVAALRWVGVGLGILLRAVLVAWASLAIYYSNLPWPGVRLALSLTFAAFALWVLAWSRQQWMRLVLAALFVGVVGWWLTIQPSHHRTWRPEVAAMPRAVIEGDRVRISHVRNFDYRSRNDFTVRYEDREVQLSRLTGLDFYVSYWSEGLIGHTFLSFVFDNAPPLAVSIETRPELGESFDPLASLFKQFELIYIVGAERDLVGVRTNHRREAVYLYRLNTSAADARQLLLVYLARINELAERAEFYHLLSNSCTINIIRYANAAGRVGRLPPMFFLHPSKHDACGSREAPA